MPTSTQALFKPATGRADKLRAKCAEFDFGELLKLEPLARHAMDGERPGGAGRYSEEDRIDRTAPP
jgi:hypothetical protein